MRRRRCGVPGRAMCRPELRRMLVWLVSTPLASNMRMGLGEG